MAYTVMAYTVIACIVMAYTVMAYTVMAAIRVCMYARAHVCLHACVCACMEYDVTEALALGVPATDELRPI